MTTLTDEQLMAYADDALQPAERQKVEKLVAADPALKDQVAIYKKTGQQLAAVFADRLREPVPAHLISLIENYQLPNESESQKAKAGTLSKLLAALTSPLELIRAPQFAALGAAASVVAGVVIGAYGSSLFFDGRIAASDGIQIGAIQPDSDLGRYLSTKRSGTTFAMPVRDGSDRKFSVALTFRTKDGRYCRQFSVRGTQAGAVTALACLKSGQQSWNVVTAVAAPPVRAKRSGVRAAGDRRSAELELTVDRLIDDIPLGPADEQKLIKRNWR